jgi:hypothetical protein
VPGGLEKEVERARAATGDELNGLVYHPAAAVLAALLDNPAFDEGKLTLLLARKDIPGEILAEIGSRKALMKSYAVKKALLFHPKAPRLVALRLVKDLYLMDLVQFALSPAVSAELKRYAEEQVVARLPQLPLGQRITLARRGPARVAGALVAEGHAQVLPIALDNPYLTEAQVLKALARDKVSTSVVQALARHGKWSQSYHVRLALVRHPATPVSVVLGCLPLLTVNDLRELAAPGIVAENLRKYLQAEVQRRMAKSHQNAAREITVRDEQSMAQPKDEQGAEEEKRGGKQKSGVQGHGRPEETDDEA